MVITRGIDQGVLSGGPLHVRVSSHRCPHLRDWHWAQFAPYFAPLQNREIIVDNVSEWLAGWSCLHNLISEAFTRLRLAHDQDTTDADAEKR
jgi:hypothetical protein